MKNSLLRSAMVLGVLLLLSVAGRAADTPVVINTAVGTALTVPGSVLFTFQKSFEGADVKGSVESAGAFIAEMQQLLRSGEVQPAVVSSVPPLVTALDAACVWAEVRAEFLMTTMNTPSTGPVQYGLLCDKMSALAAAQGAKLEQPKLLPLDRDLTADAAVAKAVELAYSQAEAVATAVRSAIYAVGSAEILEVTWEDKPAVEPGEVPQIKCTARVRMTYTLGPVE